VTDLASIRSCNFYDCIEFGGFGGALPLQSSERIFSNRNVGDVSRTNLQVAGMVTHGDDVFIMQNWYARTNIPLTGRVGDLMRLFAHSTNVTLHVNSKHERALNLYDLLRSWRVGEIDGDGVQVLRPAPGWPIVFQPRSRLTVQVDMFTDARQHLSDRVAGEFSAERIEYPRVWIHLEGLVMEHGVGVNRVIKILAGEATETRTSEQLICEWVRGIAVATPSDAAQLMAVADGIEEQRHRKAKP